MNDILHLQNDILSEHFDWAEASATLHRDIDNSIPEMVKPAIRNTAARMEVVRKCLGNFPISVSSWYRCHELNTAVGGSRGSQHVDGEAVDFICPRFGSPVDIVRTLCATEALLAFDQLILEHTWVHISFQSNPHVKPKGQVLSLLADKKYAIGITDKNGRPL